MAQFDVEKILDWLFGWNLIYLPKIVAAFFILFIGWRLAKKIARLVVLLMRRSKVDETLVGFLENILYYALLVLVVLSALSQLGVNMTAFLTVMGAAGLAVGLSLKETLANFASGVVLIFFAPFRIGDYVTIAGISGTVEKITVFSTIIRTADNQRIIVPNGKISNDVIINVNGNPTRRVSLTIGIGYGDDIAKARQVVESIFQEEGRILHEPAPSVVVSELGESSVNLFIRAWVKTTDYWPVLFDLNEKIKNHFDQEGISIPFPQRDIHLIKD